MQGPASQCLSPARFPGGVLAAGRAGERHLATLLFPFPRYCFGDTDSVVEHKSSWAARGMYSCPVSGKGTLRGAERGNAQAEHQGSSSGERGSGKENGHIWGVHRGRRMRKSYTENWQGPRSGASWRKEAPGEPEGRPQPLARTGCEPQKRVWPRPGGRTATRKNQAAVPSWTEKGQERPRR